MSGSFANRARLVLYLLVGLAGPLAYGCVPRMCLLKTCEGKRCKCAVSSCGKHSDFDSVAQQCRCSAGSISVAGRCMSTSEANKYCGKGSHFGEAGCAKDRCSAGEELDLASGKCIPREKVNQLATKLGINVASGQKLGCPAGQQLMMEGSSAACVPLAQTCSPDETWNGKACEKRAVCATGSLWNATARRCEEYARVSTEEGLSIDVNNWSVANYGADGGAGLAGFCSIFTRKPWSFGVGEGASAQVRVSIMMSFEGGEIGRGSMQTVGVFEGSGKTVPPKGASEIDEAAKSIFSPLVDGGGHASSSSITTTVKCSVVNAAKPRSVPATGGI